MDANSSTISRACRLCLAVDGVKLPIFDEEGQKRQFALKIRSCLSLEADISDPLPHIICHKCVYKLDTLHDFRETSRKCDTFLRENLITTERPTSSLGLVPIVKTERDDGAVDYEPAAKRINTSEGNDNRCQELHVETMDQDHHETQESPQIAFAFVNVDRNSPVADEFIDCEDASDAISNNLTFSDSSLLHYYKDMTKHNDTVSQIYYPHPLNTLPHMFSISDGVINKIPVFVDRGVQTDSSFVESSEVLVEVTQYKTLARRSIAYDNGTVTRKFTKKVSPVTKVSLPFLKGKGDVFKEMRVDSKVAREKPARAENFCRGCSKEFHTKELLNNHACSGRHACTICRKYFRSDMFLQVHFRTHDGTMLYDCKTCKKSFSQARNFDEHVKIHPHPRPYWCKSCDCSYKSISHLRLHHARAHDSLRPQFPIEVAEKVVHELSSKETSGTKTGSGYHCKFCSKSYSTEHNFARHKCSFKFSCRVCEKTYNSRFSLQMHQNTHDGMMLYQCKTCKKMFRSKDEFSSHLKIHPSAKPYCCSVCDKSYDGHFNLLWHFTSIHSDCEDVERLSLQNGSLENSVSDRERTGNAGNQYACGCGRSFSLKHLLEKHTINCIDNTLLISRKKNDGRKELYDAGDVCFACDYCEETFVNGEEYEKHRAWHEEEFLQNEKADSYGEENEEAVSQSEPESDTGADYHVNYNADTESQGSDASKTQGAPPERFQCKFCGIYYKSGRQLGRHMYSHRNEKSYQSGDDLQSPGVDASSGDNDSLTCSVCKKHFTQRKSLWGHLTFHARRKEYSSPSVRQYNRTWSERDAGNVHSNDSKAEVESGFPCTVCGERFDTGQQLGGHMRRHSRGNRSEVPVDNVSRTFVSKKFHGKKQFLCIYCGQQFSMINHLANHFKRHGKDKLKFTLTDYEAMMKKAGVDGNSVADSTASALNTVEEQEISPVKTTRTVPPAKKDTPIVSENEFQCDICQYKFRSEEVLKKHVRDHKSKPFSCDICGKLFKTGQYVSQHKLLHVAKTAYTCDTCGKVFVSRPGYFLHMLRRHGKRRMKNTAALKDHESESHKFQEEEEIPNDDAIENDAGGDEDESYPDNRDVQAVQVNDKENIGFVEQRSENDNLLAIKKNSSGRFSCTICDKFFTSKYSVYRHLAINHTSHHIQFCKLSDDLFYCKICRKQFPHFEGYSAHARSLHGETVQDEIISLTSSSGDVVEESSEPIDNKEYNDKQCDICNFKFSTRKELEEHKEDHKTKKHMCDLCGKLFDTLYHAKIHRAIHTGKMSHICRVCGESFKSRDNLLNHLAGVHKSVNLPQGELPTAENSLDTIGMLEGRAAESSSGKTLDSRHMCCLCGETFERSTFLSDHMKTHGIKNYTSWKAKQIKLLQNSSRTLSRRSVSITSESENMYNRPMKSSMGFGAMDATFDAPDAGNLPHSCSDCKSSFPTHQDLEKHLKEHENMPSCDICGRVFHNKAHLKEHKVVHEGGKSYTCNICEKVFSTSPACMLHMRRSHNAGPSNMIIKGADETGSSEGKGRIEKDHHSTKGAASKTFSCEFCGRLFYRCESWKQHRRIHTGERPYACEVCGKTFRMQSSRYAHVKFTHKKKPMNWRVYLKSRGQNALEASQQNVPNADCEPSESSNVTEAEPEPLPEDISVKRLSSDGKYHFCNICNKKLSVSTNLRRHMNMVHKLNLQKFQGQSSNNAVTKREPKPQAVIRKKGQLECEVCSKRFTSRIKLKRHACHAHRKYKLKQPKVQLTPIDVGTNDQDANMHSEGEPPEVDMCIVKEFETDSGEDYDQQLSEESLNDVEGASQNHSKIEVCDGGTSLYTIVEPQQLNSIQGETTSVSYLVNEENTEQYIMPPNQVILYQPDGQNVSYISNENESTVVTDIGNANEVSVENEAEVFQEYLARVSGDANASEETSSKEGSVKGTTGNSVGSSTFLVSETESYNQVPGDLLCGWQEEVVDGRNNEERIIITSGDTPGIVISPSLVLTNNPIQQVNN